MYCYKINHVCNLIWQKLLELQNPMNLTLVSHQGLDIDSDKVDPRTYHVTMKVSPAKSIASEWEPDDDESPNWNEHRKVFVKVIDITNLYFTSVFTKTQYLPFRICTPKWIGMYKIGVYKVIIFINIWHKFKVLHNFEKNWNSNSMTLPCWALVNPQFLFNYTILGLSQECFCNL